VTGVQTCALPISQLEGPVEHDWLSSFARRDEAFFSERFERRAGRAVTVGAICDDAAQTCSVRRGAFVESSTWSSSGFSGASVHAAE
jgi:hypothetical protein